MNVMHHEKGRDPYYKIWHSASNCMIIYFYTDGGKIVFQNGIYPIQRGSLCFVRARQQHYTLPEQPEEYDRSKIFFSEELMGELLKTVREDRGMTELFQSSSVIYGRIPEAHWQEVERLYEEAWIGLKERNDSAMFRCCCLRLLLYLRDYLGEHMTNTNDRLTRTIDFINRSYASPITLDDICREVYSSKYYLCRTFKNAVGMTIMEYLLKTRLAAAKSALLSEEESSIGEISEKCGFSGVSYFSQAFKKNTGFSPNQYRKRFGKSRKS